MLSMSRCALEQLQPQTVPILVKPRYTLLTCIKLNKKDLAGLECCRQL